MSSNGTSHSDADMTWRRADGTFGEYRGELIELGMGIPRPMGADGLLAFAARSLFPRRAAIIDAADIQTITCDVPPPGWWCSRDEGHDGPCAAHPWRDDPRLTDKA